MLSKNLYKVKKSPLAEKRKKLVLFALVSFSLFFIFYGFYSLKQMKPASGQKEEVKIETGDRPLKKDLTIYVNVSGGLNLRADRDSSSEKLALIPNKTKLEVSEELEGWYKVTYKDKTGWVSKEFTTTDEPAQDPYKEWSEFSSNGFTVKYPLGWKVKNYGANAANKTSSLVAFSNQELTDSLPEGSEFIAPVVIKISTQSIEDAKKSYESISGVQTQAVTIAGQTGTKYIYTSSYSNTQMTAIVLGAGSKVFIFTEGGGYQDDLSNMIKTFSIGG